MLLLNPKKLSNLKHKKLNFYKINNFINKITFLKHLNPLLHCKDFKQVKYDNQYDIKKKNLKYLLLFCFVLVISN